MSFLRHNWRPTFAVLSVAVPFASQRQPIRCSEDMKWLSNTTVSAKFVSNVQIKDANKLLEKVEKTSVGNSDTIDDRLAYLWTELVNWNREKKMSLNDAMDHEVPVEWIRGLKPSIEELDWLRPVMKWVEDPEIMSYLDVDNNNKVSFKEFSILLLLALTQIEGDSDLHVTKKKFIKSMYFLMDLDNNGEIDKEEFVCICSLLAAIGMIDANRVDETCRKRGRKRKGVPMVETVSQTGDFRSAFANAFHMYDEDGDKTISEYEWFLFAGEWLGWNLERNLEE